MSRRPSVWLIMIGLLIGTGALALSIGPVRIALWNPSPIDQVILLSLRLPRVLSAFLVGAGLALAGAIFQGLFRNPIADSYLLGVSSGASLGAAVAIVWGLASPLASFAAVSVFAFLGALLALALVFFFARTADGFSIFRLLLAGLGIGLLLSSMVALMMLMAGEELKALILFFLGGFSTSTWDTTWVALACIPVAAIVACRLAPELNVLMLGEETAATSGVNTSRVQLVYALLAALLTAISVAVAGLIGFMGLIVPHIVRLTQGSDHRVVLPLTFFAGGIFLVLCDAAARAVIAPAELPVGVVTSLIGVPVFLYLIRREPGDHGF